MSRGWQGAVLLRDPLMWEPVQVTGDIGTGARVEDGQEGEPEDSKILILKHFTYMPKNIPASLKFCHMIEI